MVLYRFLRCLFFTTSPIVSLNCPSIIAFGQISRDQSTGHGLPTAVCVGFSVISHTTNLLHPLCIPVIPLSPLHKTSDSGRNRIFCTFCRRTRQKTLALYKLGQVKLENCSEGDLQSQKTTLKSFFSTHKEYYL